MADASATNVPFFSEHFRTSDANSNTAPSPYTFGQVLASNVGTAAQTSHTSLDVQEQQTQSPNVASASPTTWMNHPAAAQMYAAAFAAAAHANGGSPTITQDANTAAAAAAAAAQAAAAATSVGVIHPQQGTTTSAADPNTLHVSPVLPVAPVTSRPTFVNAKQYHRIIKRREARAKLELYYKMRRDATASSSSSHPDPLSQQHSQLGFSDSAHAMFVLSSAGASGASSKASKSYMHESRHKHAMNRPRGPGGRFLKKHELEEYYRQNPELDPKRQKASD